ncbi:hypothetical protein [Frondihabitans cladoniiphilus]|uniref:Uncharacterized protein n=1 Tax=Frondihabitans cladoniiphilus TaxID=715785 RepID=A0ABP8W4N4_9MICO
MDTSRYHPYELEPRAARPVLRPTTYLPVDALPIVAEGQTIGWLWWNDSDLAAQVEPVRLGGSPADPRLASATWNTALADLVARGSLPSRAVELLRSAGPDTVGAAEPNAGRPEAGDARAHVPEGAEPVRLPYRHLLHRAGSPGAVAAPAPAAHPACTQSPAGTQPPAGAQPAPSSGLDAYARDMDPALPVAYAAFETDGEVTGWLWWNDDQQALGHVANHFAASAREADGTTILGEHPWQADLRIPRSEGLPPSAAVRRLMSDEPDEAGHRIPVELPQRARSLAHLREIAGQDDYDEARVRFEADQAEAGDARRALEAAYYAEHPDEAGSPTRPPRASKPRGLFARLSARRR